MALAPVLSTHCKWEGGIGVSAIDGQLCRSLLKDPGTSANKNVTIEHLGGKVNK